MLKRHALFVAPRTISINFQIVYDTRGTKQGGEEMINFIEEIQENSAENLTQRVN